MIYYFIKIKETFNITIEPNTNDHLGREINTESEMDNQLISREWEMWSVGWMEGLMAPSAALGNPPHPSHEQIIHHAHISQG